MEDDKLRQMLSGYNPPMKPAGDFMAALRRNMEAVEAVKRQMAQQRRRNRVAVVIAGLCGFGAGALLTLLFPMLSQWISVDSLSLPGLGVLSYPAVRQVMCLSILAIVSVLTAVNAYEIALARLPQGGGKS